MGSCVCVCEDNAAGRLSTGLYAAAVARALCARICKRATVSKSSEEDYNYYTTTLYVGAMTVRAAAGTAADG